MKVIHCKEFVGSHSQNLVEGERRLGIDSRFVSLQSHKFGYKVDEVLTSADSGILKIEYERWKLLVRLILKADVVHFTGGRSLMPVRYTYQTLKTKIGLKKSIVYWVYALIFESVDLYVLRLFRKKIFVTFMGSDARLRVGYGRNQECSEFRMTEKEKSLVQNRIDAFEKLAFKIYFVNPDLRRFLPKCSEFLPYAMKYEYSNDMSVQHRVPKILHAPSKRGIKGTDNVLETIRKLKSKGLDFEFKLVEGLPHNELFALFDEYDLLIDQLVVGWYGTIAVEFLSKNKDVMCYIEKEPIEVVSNLLTDCPIISVDSGNLESKLESYIQEFPITNQSKHPNINKNKPFLDAWHMPEVIANSTISDYRSALHPD